MPQVPRPVRPRIERQSPLRGPQTAYRRAEVDPPKRRAGGPLTSSEDVVIEAVKLGYKIADEQIAKGQEFARRLRGASVRSEAGDVGDVFEQGLRLARHFAVLLVELTETSLNAPTVFRNLSRDLRDEEAARERDPSHSAAADVRSSSSSSATAPVTTAAAAPPRGAPTRPVPIRVRSARAARVTVSLQRALSKPPEVFPLYLQGNPQQALHDVKFIVLERDEYCLSVTVDTQPAGTYRGYAVEGEEIVAIITVVVEQ